MKTIASTAIVALMTAAIGLTAIAPTYAQDAAPMPGHERSEGKGGPGFEGKGGPGFDLRFNRQMPRQGGFDLFSFERGAEAVEIALVRLSYAIDLTDAQQALFDTLKTDALAAADTFSTAVEGLRPAAPTETAAAPAVPDLAERFENRIAVETAHLEALKAVQPALTAFLDSLTDEQKAELMPQRPGRDGGPGEMGKGGMRHPGMHPGTMPVPAPDAPTNG